jgi:hypothetical protein
MTDAELQTASQLFETSMALPDAVASSITDSYYAAGENAAKGYTDGINDNAENAAYAAGELGKASCESLATALDEHSPSKTTEEMGVNFDQGMADGIEGSTDVVLKQVNQMAARMLTTAKDGMSQDTYRGIGANIAQGLAQGIASGEGAVVEAIQKLCSGAVTAAKTTLGINSPSKEFEYIGEMSGAGYIEGWQQRMADIEAVISDGLPDTDSINSRLQQTQQGSGGGDYVSEGIVVNQYFYGDTRDYKRQQKEAAKQMRDIVRSVAV